MKPNPSYHLFPFNEISDIEPKPGLYAWYMKLQIGKGNTKTSKDTTKALCKISEIICYPDLELCMEGHLKLQMKGGLKHLWYGHDENKHSSGLKKTINNPDSRVILSEILEAAVPLLSSPLYIGVSKDLKLRLATHKKLIEAFQQDTTQTKNELASIAPVDDTKSFESDKNFAERVVGRGIDPNHLLVGVMQVSLKDVDDELVRETVEAAETLLNRFFYPILGRR
jgi:hypothetical protein